MKKITLLIALLVSVSILFAQKNGVAPLAKGEKQVNFGTGFSNHGIPIYASFDIALHKDVTITPEAHMKFGDGFKGGVLLKADYHWNYLIGIPSNWDFYAGVRVGFDAGGDFFLDAGAQVGGRWYWSDIWGVNLEIGGGTGFGTTVGVSMKL